MLFQQFKIITLSSQPTVCVTGAGAGVDNVWEQRKLEARKLLVNRTESPASSAYHPGALPGRFVGRGLEDSLA